MPWVIAEVIAKHDFFKLLEISKIGMKLFVVKVDRLNIIQKFFCKNISNNISTAHMWIPLDVKHPVCSLCDFTVLSPLRVNYATWSEFLAQKSKTLWDTARHMKENFQNFMLVYFIAPYWKKAWFKKKQGQIREECPRKQYYTRFQI